MTGRVIYLLPLLSLFFTGCGTFSDALCGPITEDRYYRGVRFDVWAAHEGGRNLLLIADLPFSAAADTVLVPFIACDELTNGRRTLRRISEERKEDKQPNKKVTQENFDKIKNGMSEAEVDAILGKGVDEGGGISWYSRRWDGPDMSIAVRFTTKGVAWMKETREK